VQTAGLEQHDQSAADRRATEPQEQEGHARESNVGSREQQAGADDPFVPA